MDDSISTSEDNSNAEEVTIDVDSLFDEEFDEGFKTGTNNYKYDNFSSELNEKS
ncbi:hypothetical protein ACE198_21420 [Neobacillus sp. KR4-4]|uniref:hypothetical protein n=1 Tax=Neobacillus sp. KR4-4 TaxID=3344872 RepID=UPI0035CAFEE2